jgi:hypothetical protein
MDVIGIGGAKKVFHIRSPPSMRKSDVSKTLNQPLRGKLTYELRLALQSPPVPPVPAGAGIGWATISHLRHRLNRQETATGKETVGKNIRLGGSKVGTCLGSCLNLPLLLFDTLERGSGKEIILSVVKSKCYFFGSGLLT